MSESRKIEARAGLAGFAGAAAEMADSGAGDRLSILKTYKLYVDGKFPRTESGRYRIVKGADGRALANACLASRKDFRDAVSAARKAQGGWGKATAYLRGQILYRAAEVLEGRTGQFIDELVALGAEPEEARREVVASIERLVHFAGWSDKYQAVYSAVNPVAAPYFCFSMMEPMGVVAALAGGGSPLLSMVSVLAPAVVGGNSVVALAPVEKALPVVTLGEVLATCDLPGGVANVLTGDRAELLGHFASHMDVNAVLFMGATVEERKKAELAAAENLKRLVVWEAEVADSVFHESPYRIQEFQETKTTWHPVSG